MQDVKKIQKIESEAGEIKGNIENIVKELRNSLGKEGALISSVDFEKQSNEHKFLAKLWFGGFVFSIIFTIVMVIILSSGIIPFLNLLDENNELGHIIQVSLFKIILLSVAYLLIHQSIKNYKINRHLYVLNKHRQLTLSIYPLMLHATNNPEQSNIILGQASKAIFEPGMTGYLEKDDNTNPINLTEVINKIADKK
ncbi:MAG: hypothetical protein NT116_02250 [Candidatus Parcubacteria bacterium]|nr:hypothetical protein [Candidatus Parcubacteria bacterium]